MPNSGCPEICETYGIHVDLHAKIWQLSVGEQQWVEILKALYVGSEAASFWMNLLRC